ncbi:MAG: hypothetical protein EOO62_00970 [Hymenobacter sp.]|nr:MAG: hypothetical protein EOO62_00970 [Hymenobacter sp.]
MISHNIIMVCQQNWNLEIDSSAKNLAKAFACHNKVLYVNAPLDVNTLLRNWSTAEVREKLRIVTGQQAGLRGIYARCLMLFGQLAVIQIFI